ncbi:MAG TPA: PIN domain-containing protein [Candidatus Competibacter sp.]|nr:PIN domain-containing protein [Candidatus Competibacter sp.]HRW65540.1 PIN domain-containing protein [Candidatus Competibacter sp.]
MISRVLLDTSPLVAILSRRDDYHRVCVEQLHEISPPLLTCWPVLTEAAWLLRKEPMAIQRLFQGFETGLLKLLTLDETAAPWIATFLHRYRELGAQLADACLIYLAEHEKIETVFTLDRRDFSVYRLSDKRALNILPET